MDDGKVLQQRDVLQPHDMLRRRDALRQRVGGGVLAADDRPQVQAPPKLQAKELAELLKAQDFDVQKFHEGDHHVELTTATPFVEGRGSLNFLVPRSIWGEPGGTASWLAQDGATLEQDGFVEIWLHGLEEGATYIGEVRVGSIPWEGGPNEFEVTSSYGAPFSVTAQGGIGQTIPLFVQDHEHGMALTRIKAPGIDWLFFGADFHRI